MWLNWFYNYVLLFEESSNHNSRVVWIRQTFESNQGLLLGNTTAVFHWQKERDGEIFEKRNSWLNESENVEKVEIIISFIIMQLKLLYEWL